MGVVFAIGGGCILIASSVGSSKAVCRDVPEVELPSDGAMSWGYGRLGLPVLSVDAEFSTSPVTAWLGRWSAPSLG